MDTNLTVFNHADFGNVRAIGDSENPRFCLADVCKVLELPQVAKVVQRLEDEVLSRHPIVDNLGRTQEMYFINEDGLYDVILDSRKPNAKKFRKWLTSEVIPSIRKTGLYINPNAPIDPNFLRRIADELEAKDKQIATLTEEKAKLKPKADYCDLILQSKEALPVTVIAKDYGMSAKAFNNLLHEMNIQFKSGKTWVLYQLYAGLGYVKSVTTVAGNGFVATINYWTQKGRMFLYNILKKANILPPIEREAPMKNLL
ncbi:MAG: phage antirepressor KilAC domain-containing protein [Clostridia bacterium]|nr:phage antirepressor KilAC domain-containing protein [Clostridia bacterium]